MSLKWKFIVNPNAGTQRCVERWEKAEPYIKKSGIDYDMILTTARKQGKQLAIDAINDARHET